MPRTARDNWPAPKNIRRELQPRTEFRKANRPFPLDPVGRTGEPEPLPGEASPHGETGSPDAPQVPGNQPEAKAYCPLLFRICH